MRVYEEKSKNIVIYADFESDIGAEL